MKKVSVFVLIVISVLLLVSCELSGTAPSKGTLHVVAMGDNFNHIPTLRLTTCENDATAVCQVFEYWGKKAGMKTDIHNCNRTCVQGLISALDEVYGVATEDDLTVIFLSTHGDNQITDPVPYSESNTDKAVFVLENPKEDDQGYEPWAFHMDELETVAEAIPGKVLVIADLCFSGAFIHQDNYTYNNKNFTDSSAIKLFLDGTPATDSNKNFYLTACTYYDIAMPGDNYGIPLSLFTWYLLKSLGMVGFETSRQKVAISEDVPVLKNDMIILSDIHNYIYTATSSIQTPQMNTGVQDLILFNLK